MEKNSPPPGLLELLDEMTVHRTRLAELLEEAAIVRASIEAAAEKLRQLNREVIH